MDSETESTKSHTESDEDDFGNYFLQPSTSPYDITKKVVEANVDLFNTNLHLNDEKSAKVKFREELVSFEPELTDEDINSIESDHIEIWMDQCPLILGHNSDINNHTNILDTDEAKKQQEEEEEEYIESIESACDVSVKHIQFKEENINVINTEANDVRNSSVTPTSCQTNNKRKKTIRKTNASFFNSNEICCKSHCLDKLDFDLSVSINKLNIHEKVTLPPLHLLQRKCCDKTKHNLNSKLPNYKGLKSEYGLNSKQLLNLEKQKKANKLKEEMQYQIIEQYRQRKIHQNEKVFRRWLKEVSTRKSKNKNFTKQTIKNIKHTDFSTTSFSTKVNSKLKQRSKSAGVSDGVAKNNTKQPRRPHTTHSCVYIELPPSILEEGFSIGNLIVTNQRLTKKLHILAIS